MINHPLDFRMSSVFLHIFLLSSKRLYWHFFKFAFVSENGQKIVLWGAVNSFSKILVEGFSFHFTSWNISWWICLYNSSPWISSECGFHDTWRYQLHFTQSTFYITAFTTHSCPWAVSPYAKIVMRWKLLTLINLISSSNTILCSCIPIMLISYFFMQLATSSYLQSSGRVLALKVDIFKNTWYRFFAF